MLQVICGPISNVSNATTISSLCNINHKFCMKACKVCLLIGSYILHTNIMRWKQVWTQINVLIDEVQTYEWIMNEQILHDFHY